jgi:hypothetical protein
MSHTPLRVPQAANHNDHRRNSDATLHSFLLFVGMIKD